MFAYSNNGFAMRAVAEDYQPQSGEILFAGMATEDRLETAFPSRASIIAAQTAAAALAAFKATVQSRLDATDITLMRIEEAVCLGLNSFTGSDVVTFVQYRRTLRGLMASSSVAALPTAPSYPSGT